MRVEEVFALRKWCRVKLLNGLIRQGKSLIQFGFPGSRVSLKDWCSLEATNFLSCSTPSAIECKKSREQRCNEQAIKIFISRGFQEKEAFVDDIWEFQVSMVFSMLMYGGNCVIWERISG